jgi:hypothetical protein
MYSRVHCIGRMHFLNISGWHRVNCASVCVISNYAISCLDHIAPMVNEWNTSMKHWCNDTDGQTQVLGEKPALLPLWSTEITHGFLPGLNMGPLNKSPATNRLNHGTASKVWFAKWRPQIFAAPSPQRHRVWSHAHPYGLGICGRLSGRDRWLSEYFALGWQHYSTDIHRSVTDAMWVIDSDGKYTEKRGYECQGCLHSLLHLRCIALDGTFIIKVWNISLSV